MRLLADQCVHTDAVEALRRTGGHDVVRARDVGLAKAADDTIFHYACRHARILLTFDKDFGNIARFDIRHSPGVVLIEVERLGKEALIRRIVAFCGRARERAVQGHLVLVEPHRVRRWPKTQR